MKIIYPDVFYFNRFVCDTAALMKRRLMMRRLYNLMIPILVGHCCVTSVKLISPISFFKAQETAAL
jgi:hypothetical protein